MKEEKKNEMAANATHEFFVVNITSQPLKGTVTWSGGGNSISIDVTGLAPGQASGVKQFFPTSGHNDYWRWSEKGRDYQLNCYDADRYAVVVLSDYGIGVLVTSTSPDTWKW